MHTGWRNIGGIQIPLFASGSLEDTQNARSHIHHRTFADESTTRRSETHRPYDDRNSYTAGITYLSMRESSRAEAPDPLFLLSESESEVLIAAYVCMRNGCSRNQCHIGPRALFCIFSVGVFPLRDR